MTVTIKGDSNVNLDYSSGGRITGDFTNATVLNRAMFQTSTANSTTGIYALPSGTSTAASWQATNNADPTNASKVLIATNGTTDCQLVSGRNGTGTYLPLTFYTNGSEQMRLDTSGNLTVGGSAVSRIVSGTAQATTSGTAVGFTGIPSWVKRVTFQIAGVTSSGVSYVQVGSGSYVTSGYVSCYLYVGAVASSTTGFLGTSIGATYGSIVLTLENSATNTWIAQGSLWYPAGPNSYVISGQISLAGALDRIQLNGGTFSAGSVNILYEG